MTEQDKKKILMKAIEETKPPAHCQGCDEYICGGLKNGEEDEQIDVMFRRIWKEIKAWGDKKQEK